MILGGVGNLVQGDKVAVLESRLGDIDMQPSLPGLTDVHRGVVVGQARQVPGIKGGNNARCRAGFKLDRLDHRPALAIGRFARAQREHLKPFGQAPRLVTPVVALLEAGLDQFDALDRVLRDGKRDILDHQGIAEPGAGGFAMGRLDPWGQLLEDERGPLLGVLRRVKAEPSDATCHQQHDGSETDGDRLDLDVNAPRARGAAR